MDISQARNFLLNAYDPDELVDVLKITSEEILDRFEDKIEEYIDKDEYDEDDED